MAGRSTSQGRGGWRWLWCRCRLRSFCWQRWATCMLCWPAQLSSRSAPVSSSPLPYALLRSSSGPTVWASTTTSSSPTSPWDLSSTACLPPWYMMPMASLWSHWYSVTEWCFAWVGNATPRRSCGGRALHWSVSRRASRCTWGRGRSTCCRQRRKELRARLRISSQNVDYSLGINQVEVLMLEKFNWQNKTVVLYLGIRDRN